MGSSLLFYEDMLQGVYDPFQSTPKAFDCSTDVWKDRPNVRGKSNIYFWSVCKIDKNRLTFVNENLISKVPSQVDFWWHLKRRDFFLGKKRVLT